METQKTTFKQSLGLFDATMIVAGSMIGSGIFIVSAEIGRTVGSPFYLLLTWIVTGVITLIAALSYGELAAMMPKAGGQYVYLKESYNSMVGFLYGWTLFLVIQTGTIAAVAVAFAKFTGVLIPAFSEKNILFEISGFNISAAQLLAIASLIVITFINYFGIKNGKVMQLSFTITKILALAGLIVAGFVVASGDSFWSSNFSNMWHATTTTVKDGNISSIVEISGLGLITAFGVAMVGSLFSSDAWNNVTFIAGEVKKPKRNIPLSLFWGVLIVTVIYLLANISYLCLLPMGSDPASADTLTKGILFADSDRVGVAAASQIFSNYPAYIMAALIMVSTFGCNNGMILSGARVYHTMANDGLFFKGVSKLNKYSVPGVALVFQCIWACVLCLSGKYSDLLAYVISTVLIFYILTIAGVFILRKKKPDAERPYKTFGYPVLPALYILIAGAICVNLLINSFDNTWPGFLIVIIGIPVYFIFRKEIPKPEEQQ